MLSNIVHNNKKIKWFKIPYDPNVSFSCLETHSELSELLDVWLREDGENADHRVDHFPNPYFKDS